MERQATFGSLKILRELAYFDGPVLFLAGSPSEVVYLALLVDRTAAGETFLYAPASENRIDFVLSGDIDLATAFRRPESGFLFVVEQPYGGEEMVRCVSPTGLDADWFPAAGVRLTVKSWSVEQKATVDITTRASELWRTVMRVRLAISNRLPGRYPSGVLGAVLTNLNGTLEAIEEALERRSNQGRLPRGWVPQASFDNIAFARSSFEVELVAVHDSDMHGRSVSARAAKEIARLVEAGTSPDELSKRVVEVEAKAAVRYRRLMTSLKQGQSSIEVAWAAPERGATGVAKVGARDVPEVVAVLERMGIEEAEEKAIVCEFKGFWPVTKSFALWDTGGQRWYRGKTDESALAAASSAKLSASYRAVMKAIIEHEEITGRTHLKWHLQKLEEVPPSPEESADLHR